MVRPLRKRDVIALIRNEVQLCGSQRKAAFKMGISPAYLCDILKGKREVSATVAACFGLVVVVRFVPIEDARAQQQPAGNPSHDQEGDK